MKPTEEVLGRVGRLLPDSGRILVALSGGADSAVVAWAAVDVAGRTRVRAAYVHHGLDASDALWHAAEAVAHHLGIRVTRIDIRIPAGPSFEGRARDVRLAALEREAADGETILTGHHQGDVAETVLANLVRGAGTRGLSGIVRGRGPWLRPLLEVPADVVRAAAVELSLPFIDDPTNAELDPTRNILRHEVLPAIESALGRPVSEPLARAAGLLAADDALIVGAADRIALREIWGAVAASAAEISVSPGPVAARVARRMLRALHPPYPGTSADVDAILDVARGDRPRMQLTGAAHVVREGPLVIVHGGVPEAPGEVPLPVESEVRFGPWVLSMRRVASRMPILLGRDRILARVLEDASVRAAGPGERIDLDGGSKPVREAMSEAGIPERLRAAWPVIAAGGKIAWVPGARLASWARRDTDIGTVVLAIEGTGA